MIWLGVSTPGKEADLVVLDWKGGPLTRSWRQSLVVDEAGPSSIEQAADLLFGLMIEG